MSSLVLALTAGIAIAQNDGTSTLRFEAASIRPRAPGGPPISGTTINANRLRAFKTTLLDLIQGVYRSDALMSAGQVVGGPDWIRTERWEINAVAAMAPTRTQFNEMLRNLLDDRFKLRVRREQREIAVFALLAARDDRRPGPQLTSVTVDCKAHKDAFERLQSAPRDLSKPLQPTMCDTLISSGPSGPSGTRIAGRALELSVLARTLTSYFDAPVLDRTGLAGQFDYDLNFVRDPAQAASPDGVVLETALREQLGLRVERQRAPMDVLVIAAAERPTPD
jgi:uncharacterized protein (TIGR03435 family)